MFKYLLYSLQQLNMLHRRNKKTKSLQLSLIHIYLIYINLCISEDIISILIHLIDWFLLNTLLFQTILSIIWLTLYILHLTIHTVQQLTSFLHIYLIYLWSFPFEFSAIWIFNLLLLLSSDIFIQTQGVIL